MAEQIGTEALEHEDLLRVVAADVGSTDDPQALAFWQSSDVLGTSSQVCTDLGIEAQKRGVCERPGDPGEWRGDRSAAKENLPPQTESCPLHDG